MSSKKESPPPSIPDLAKSVRKLQHFAQGPGGQLFVYQNGVYRPDGEDAVRLFVKQVLTTYHPHCWNSQRAEELVKYLVLECPRLLDRPPLDTLNVLNGLLDVSTSKLRLHAPAFLSAVQLPVKFDPAARCPAWDEFVAEVFPPDAQALPWELLAWLMLPIQAIQKALLFVGKGANGKSTFLRALTRFLGSENVCTLSLQRLETDRFATSRLMGKLANICPDLPSNRLTTSSIFKAITGGDRLLGEQKFKECFEFTPFARLVFATNEPPSADDASDGYYRRWLAVPFTQTFQNGPALGRRLDEKLAAPGELSGALNRALAALPRILREGISVSATMRAATEGLRHLNDDISAWLHERCVLDPEAVEPVAELLEDYVLESGDRLVKAEAFGRAVRRVFPGVQRRQRTVNGRLQWCYVGISRLSQVVTSPVH